MNGIPDSGYELLKGILRPPSSRPTRLQQLLPTSGTQHELQARLEARHPDLLWILGGLRGLAQVIFINNPISGLVLLVAVALASPLAAGLGLLGALVGMAAALLLGASPETIAQGLWGYNGVLVAIAIGGIFYAPGLGSLAVALAGAVLASLIQWLWSISPAQGWPSFTLAFVLATWLVQLLVRRTLPALLPVSLHAIQTPEEHRQRFVLARTVLGDFRRNLDLSLKGQRQPLLAGRVPISTRRRISQLFQRLDRDGDGAISAAELLEGLQPEHGVSQNREELVDPLTAVLSAMDLDRNGQVDAGEFAELMLRLQRLRAGEGRLLTYLLPVDANGDDRLDPAELRRLLTSVGVPPLAVAEERALFARSPRGLSWRQFVDRLLLT